jgi:hypothetical protein
VRLFQPYVNPNRLLVDPCDRLQFAILVLLSTILIHWSATALLSHGVSMGLLTYPFHPFLHGALRGVLHGTAIGVGQWPLFRRYVPDPRWVIAIILGYIVVWGGIAVAGDILHQAEQAVSHFTSVQIHFAAEAIAAPLCLVTGLLQYIVLRPYAVSVAWWIVLPLFSYSLSLGLSVSYYFGGDYLLWPLRLNIGAFLYTMDALVLSISFCSLIWSRGQSENVAELNSDSPLLSVPKINGFWATRSLISKLEKRIDKAWKAELSHSEPLTYLLGVNSRGAIIDCLPANQASTTFVNQTPLLLLMQAVDLNLERQFPLALIQVSFDSLGQLKIKNCRKVSIIEMASILILLGLLISFYPTWLSALTHR